MSYEIFANMVTDRVRATFATLSSTRVLLTRVNDPAQWFQTLDIGDHHALPIVDVAAKYLELTDTDGSREHHCLTCLQFLKYWGDALVVDVTKGTVESLCWDGLDHEALPTEYVSVVQQLSEFVLNDKRALRYFTVPVERRGGGDRLIEFPIEKGGYTHFAVEPRPLVMNYSAKVASDVETSRQMFVDTRQWWRLEVLKERIVPVLEHDPRMPARFRERFEDYMRLRTLVEDSTLPKAVRYAAVIAAVPGTSRFKETVVGKLVEALYAGSQEPDSGFSERAWREFSDRIAAENYKSPTALPSEQSVKDCEELTERLGLATALQRRQLRRDEVVAMYWKPAVVEAEAAEESGSVFGKVKTKDTAKAAVVEPVVVPKGNVSWAVFKRDYIPRLKALQVSIPVVARWVGFTTAANADAGCLLKWDTPDARNPVNGWAPSEPEYGSSWGLRPLSWCVVQGVTDHPSKWVVGEPTLEHSIPLLVLAEGKIPEVRGSLLFPDSLRHEYHPYRKVIAQFSHDATLGAVEDTPVGLSVLGSLLKATLEDGVVIQCTIDRVE